MSDVDQAAAFFEEGFSCSQSVLGAASERHGLPRATALRLADAFGGGMGALGRTCGAVTGALMVLGLARGRTRADDLDAKRATHEAVQRFVAEFERRHGSTECKVLLGCDIHTPELARAAREAGRFTVCAGLVRSAAELLEEILGP
jgi:C_GCAxxG_C_C family probable redox protein